MLFINILKLIKSFGYALKGLKTAVLTEQNIRIHIIAIIIVSIAGWYFNIQAWEWVAISICFGMVTALELINTAIENLTDLTEPNHNPIAGKVKDLAAAAVFIAAMASVVVGIIIFGKHIVNLFT